MLADIYIYIFFSFFYFSPFGMNAEEMILLPTSWRQMKESQRMLIDIDSQEIQSAAPLNLYKIFREKSSSRPSLHKSLPDLSFILHYTTELPLSPGMTRTTPSPTLIHHQSDRPRTLKSIKRYKNRKHSTESLHVLRRSTSLTNRGRCQSDNRRIDPFLQRYSLTDSPPNEFCLQAEENFPFDLDEPVPIIEQAFSAMNSSILDHLLQRISSFIKRLFELKQSDKRFFFDNEQNRPLDFLLKNDLCPAIQTILEHGRKDLKKVTLWKIIQLSITSPTHIPPVYIEAKQIALNASSFWLYRFQAFIFALLNKNELINWLYYFTRQKDLIQRYYQSPDALILVSLSSTFNIFERMMTQLEKLTSLTFHLTYHPPSNDEPLTTTSARDWLMTMNLSRRTWKTNTEENHTLRSTLARKFNAIFK